MEGRTTEVMECAHCGETFEGNPRNQPLGRNNYCSISCEDGRGPIPDSSPESPNYWLYVQGNPKAPVGSRVIATGLKRVDYSPDWCRNPEDVHRSAMHKHIPEESVYIRRTHIVLGTIIDYDEGQYTVVYDDLDTGDELRRIVDATVMLEQLRRDQWWIED